MTYNELEQLCQTQVTKHFGGTMVLLNSSFEIVYASSYITEMTGFLPEELLGQPVSKLFPSNVDVIRANLAQGEIPSYIKFYQAIRCKDNRSISTRIRLSKEWDVEGNLHFILYIKDNSPFQRLRYDLLKKAVTIEKLSKSALLMEESSENAILEILTLASKGMMTQRVNAWLFNEEHTKIICQGSFDSRREVQKIEDELKRIQMPSYFSLFETEKIIITIDAMTNPRTAELLDNYIRPSNIHSMMDIPFRIEGKIIGVLCFEHVGQPREWNLQDQAFGVMIAQMISLVLETSKRKKACKEASEMLAEKNVLLREVEHRVKNNLSLITGLISIQQTKTKDNFHNVLLADLRQKIISIAEVHSLLYQSENYTSINLKKYMGEILKNLSSTLLRENQKIRLRKSIDDTMIDVCYAIPLALITTELVTNSYKYAFGKKKDGQIDVGFSLRNNIGTLKIKDDGKGFRLNRSVSRSGGLEIVRSLSEQIGAEMTFDNRSGSGFQFRFPYTAA
jgi:two-component sensor histidine kinase